VIRSFIDRGTEDIFDRKNTREARQTCPQQIWRVAQRKLDQLNGVVSLESLRIPPGNFLEALKDEAIFSTYAKKNHQVTYSKIAYKSFEDYKMNVQQEFLRELFNCPLPHELELVSQTSAVTDEISELL